MKPNKTVQILFGATVLGQPHRDILSEALHSYYKENNILDDSVPKTLGNLSQRFSTFLTPKPALSIQRPFYLGLYVTLVLLLQ